MNREAFIERDERTEASRRYWERYDRFRVPSDEEVQQTLRDRKEKPMQVSVKGSKTEIKLSVFEQRRLRETSGFLNALARHSDGADEKSAAEAVSKIVDKWAPESSDAAE